MNNSKNHDLLQRFHPDIRKYITEIWKNEKIGICVGNYLTISKPVSSIVDENVLDIKNANIFSISVPYAGHYLEWKVIFANDDFTFAPDFDFGDDDRILGDLSVSEIEKFIPSLVNWDANDPRALIKVIKEILELYKLYQMKLLEDDKYTRLYFEYSSLVGTLGVPKEDIEVLIESSGVVHFLISLSVDFGSLPPYLNKSEPDFNPGRDAAILMITFHQLDGTKTQPQLFLSPYVEQVLGGSRTKHIPPFPAEECLINYVPAVKKLVVDKVKAIVDNYTLKNKYIAAILAQNPFSVLEYDSVTFSKITLLFEKNNFYWILHITISNNFPREKPKWILRSTYHMINGTPYTETLEDYPYSPRWTPEEMCHRAFLKMLEHAPNFQINSIKTTTN